MTTTPTPAIVPRSAVRGTLCTFEQLFLDENGLPLAPLDPQVYPMVSIITPEEEILQTGHALSLGDGRWRYVWSVPADASLSTDGQQWRIEWIMVTTGNRSLELASNFEVIDAIETDPLERAYTQICMAEASERLLIKFRRPQESISLTFRGGVSLDYTSRIQHVQQDGFHVYFVDTDPLSYGAFLGIWRARESMISPYTHYVQNVRVPEDMFWTQSVDLRMMIDKVQKRAGSVSAYSDSDLYYYLTSGVQYINTVNPITNWSLLYYPPYYGMPMYLTAAAAWIGLQAQYLAESEQAFSYSGQVVTLDVDRTAYYDTAITRLREFLTTELGRTKSNMVRRTNAGALATRPYDYGLSNLVVRVQSDVSGQNAILPLMSRLGLL